MQKVLFLCLFFTGLLEAESPTPRTWSRPYGLAGCGLGHKVVGKRGLQLFAATTNASSLNQTFGISTGTLGCDDGITRSVASKMDGFVSANQISLATDIARGNGETVSGLSVLMNCKDAAALGNVLQQKYQRIFPDLDISPNEITDAIISVVIESPPLACSQVSG